jgi:hypothetical protein
MNKMNRLRRQLAGVIVVMSLLGTLPQASAAEGPFHAFPGSWTGSGTVVEKDGSRERIRCRVRYQVSGGSESLSQDLTCASDSFTLNVVSSVVASGGQLTGSWSETTRGVSGNITGRVDPAQVSAVFAGVGFDAQIVINTKGKRQSVVITPSGIDVKEVTISLSKT